MKASTLIIKSFFHYRRTHLGVLLGSVISTAILVGALVVGDSVRHSLQQMVLTRLGRCELALAANDRFFQTRLADDLAATLDTEVAPLLRLSGIASAGEIRANRVQVLGVDPRFWEIGAVPDQLAAAGSDPAGSDPVLINQPLASDLGLEVGDELVLRLEKIQALPGDVPFSSQSQKTVALRLQVMAVLGDGEFGRFGLKANQVPPRTAFLPLAALAAKLDREDKANVLLVARREDLTVAEANAALDANFQMADAGLHLRGVAGSGDVELIAERVFLDPPIAAAALAAGPEPQGILTYFVDRLAAGSQSIPYSFVAAPGEPLVGPEMADDEIIVNRWAAQVLGVRPGDQVDLSYRVPGPGRRLVERVSSFKVHSEVAITGAASDRGLMPEFPGLANADSCRDWDPGIPIDFDQIGDLDEQYWDEFRGTPKAFVTLAAATQMWSNRWGELTAVRFGSVAHSELASSILADLDPATLGLAFGPVRSEGVQASSQGVDFGQLFLSLSFFIIAAALLLTGLLFVLGVEQRSQETGVLLALGFTPIQVRRFLLAEGALVAVLGGLLGAACGVVYNQVVLHFLGTLWRGAVGTSALQLHIKPVTLGIGSAIGMVLAVLAMFLAARKLTARPLLELLGKLEPRQAWASQGSRNSWLLAALCGAGVVLIIALAGPGRGKEAMGAFWGAGFLMLTATLAMCRVGLLHFDRSDHSRLGLGALGRRNTARRRGRSLATVALLATGIFIVTAVGANRHSSLINAEKPSSGTGGFAWWGETTVPIRHDLNSPEGRRHFAVEDVEGGIDFVQFRVRDGDDASCLNLNRIVKPRIIGVNPSRLAGSFSFAQLGEGVDPENPWAALTQDLGANVIPAIADQTVITWAFGKKIGDELIYSDEQGHELRLRLVAGLNASVFQGSAIIAESAFTAHFPGISGSRLLLIDGQAESREIRDKLVGTSETVGTMRDYGLELTATGERLAAFSTVENTYLSIFLALGGLGMIIGTIGLGVILFRNTMERRNELAIMRAIGFGRSAINHLLLSENLLLLAAGLLGGVVSALVAVLPALMTSDAEIPFWFLAGTLIAIAASGVVATVAATWLATRGELLGALREE